MLKIEKLTKSYDGNLIFENFDLEIEKNKITCLIGKSGSGKTTLLNVLCGITEEFTMEESDFTNLSYSYIFQEPRLLDWYTVYQNMKFVLSKDEVNHKDLKKHINNYLKMVELENFSHYYPNQLSGGMAQRVSIARAFIKDFDVLLMDEPFKGLDPAQKKQLIDRFMDMWKKNRKTVLFVTHLLEEAFYISNDIFVLGDKPAKIVYSCKNVYKMEDEEKEREKEKIWQILESQT